ncbi:MAG: hypothetical protein HY543_00835 [Deltaproteobacteria bacterium]|nr:hypothetical protein [Deltaproteobacteria bacterium]
MPCLRRLAGFLALFCAPWSATAAWAGDPRVGYDGGFVIRNTEDTFHLTLNGLLQFLHRYEVVGGAPDINTFHLRRSRIAMTATLFERFEAHTYIEHRTGTALPGTPYWWAEAGYHPIDAFGVTVGMIQLPMDRQGEVEPWDLAMVEQPITATQVGGQKGKSIARQSLGLPATLGIRLDSDVGRFHGMAAVGNGESEHNFNATRAFAGSARVAVDLLGDPGSMESDLAATERPALQIGAGTGYEGQDADDDHINNVKLDWSWTGSADLAFKWRGFSFVNEWYWRKLKVKTGNFTLDDVGYYAQAGYFVLPKKLELVARGVQLFREGPNNNAYEFGGGLNWFFHGNAVKLQADVTRLRDFDDAEGEGHRPFTRLRTQLMVKF